jgi:hypothetical protein
VAAQRPAETAAFASAFLRVAARLGGDPREAFASAFPDSRRVLGMLALDRDIEDFRDYAARPDAAGAYYRQEAKLALAMRGLRLNYEAAYASAFETMEARKDSATLGTVGAPATAPQRGPDRASPYIADASEVWVPAKSELELTHPYALDIFFRQVVRRGDAEQGPPIRALYAGIVVASASDWSGGQGEAAYKSGGLSPSSGNGLVIYDPVSRRYCSYFHMSSVAFKAGSLVGGGEVLGRGGNTGMSARMAGHGGHVHIEVFDAVRGSALSAYEIRDLLAN